MTVTNLPGLRWAHSSRSPGTAYKRREPRS